MKPLLIKHNNVREQLIPHLNIVYHGPNNKNKKSTILSDKAQAHWKAACSLRAGVRAGVRAGGRLCGRAGCELAGGQQVGGQDGGRAVRGTGGDSADGGELRLVGASD